MEAREGVKTRPRAGDDMRGLDEMAVVMFDKERCTW